MAGNFEKEEKILTEFLKSIGPWRKHIVIGGGYAPIIYKLYFGERSKGNPPVGTRDLDSLLPRKVPAASSRNIATFLKDAGFERIFRDRECPPTEVYVKDIEGDEVEIEFLTDDSTRGDKTENVSIAGVVAQPLSFLKLSLKETLDFETQAGETGKVVSPGAWIFHKGLTFPRRSSGTKYYKDLYGIWYAGTQIGKFSENALKDLKKLRKENPAWSKTFCQNLSNWLKDASPSDWTKLEAQDPFGVLKRLGFEKLVKDF